MSSFGDQLEREMARAFQARTPAENPLHTIGLSPEILDLGLTEDELYKLVKDLARTLASRYHSDRPEARTARAQKFWERLSRAHNDLKSREVFDQALQEFKEKSSVLRSELNFVREQARVAKESGEQLEARIRDLQAAGADARVFGQAVTQQFLDFLILKSMQFTGSQSGETQAKAIEHVRGLTLLSFRFLKSDPPQTRKLAELRDRYRELSAQRHAKKKDWEDLQASIALARLGAAGVGNLFQSALDSDDAFPSVAWDSEIGLAQLGFGRARLTQPAVKPVSAIPGEVLTPDLVRRLDSLYRQGLPVLRKLITLKTQYVSWVKLELWRTPVACGSFRQIRGPKGREAILGSLLPADLPEWAFRPIEVSAQDHEKALEGKRRIHSSEVEERTMLLNLQPFVAPGTLLVTCAHGRIGYSLLRTASNDLRKLRAATRLRRPMIFARDIVLEVW